MKQLVIASIPMIELVIESLEVNAYAIQLQLVHETNETKQNRLKARIKEIEELAKHCNEVISNLN